MMEASVIQSLISRTRNRIRDLESQVVFYYEEVGLSDNTGFWWNLIDKAKKDIAKLVVIQKALKAELRDIYNEERLARKMAKLQEKIHSSIWMAGPHLVI